MGILSIENLSFRYPNSQKKVLDGLSLDIRRGEFVVLFGETGCGKSTLFKLIKKELSPTGEESGDVVFRGKNKRELSLRESAEEIGFVMQDPENQIVTDKVWHELSFYMENLSYSPEKIAARVGELSNYFGITPWFRRDTVHLSGGQKQLLTLASVMTVFPSLLILDEPTSRLDPIATKDFISTLKRINAELGVTVLMCEHRLEEVLPVADKVAFMREGKIEKCGAPEEVCAYLAKQGYEEVLPTPSRVWINAKGEGKMPLSVKEGRDFLANKGLDKEIPTEILPDNKTTVEMKDVWFRYDKKDEDVLRGADFVARENEIVSVVGGNGSGKSTMLKLLARLVDPYRGKVLIGGKNAAKMKKGELYLNNIAYLPQDPSAVFLHDKIKDDLGKGAEEAIKLTGIESFLDRHPNDLSGGERQKCAIAKILTVRPKIVLLDEPTKGLDVFAKRDLIMLLKELKKGRTIVLVTHDVEFAALASDRCSLLFGGELLPPAHPQKFFSDNCFYTTSASRMARGYIKGAVTCEQIMKETEE